MGNSIRRYAKIVVIACPAKPPSLKLIVNFDFLPMYSNAVLEVHMQLVKIQVCVFNLFAKKKLLSNKELTNYLIK